MTRHRSAGTAAAARLGGRDTADLGLLALGATLAAGALLYAGAAAACLLTGHPAPDGGILPALGAVGVPANPASAWPRPEQLPGPVTYWGATLVVVALAAGTGLLAARSARHALDRHGPHTGRTRLAHLPGLASRRELTTAAGEHALRTRARHARPSQPPTAPPTELGYRLGSAHGRDLWCSVEDSALLLGPPRMGKGLHVVIPWILDAPGAVVATSTRPDTLAVTRDHRATRGPIALFDPQCLAGLPDGLRWSPVRGCQHPRIALVRARGLASGTGMHGSVSDADFWTGQTETALRCLLHAAALDDRRALDLYRWSLNPVQAEDAVTVLTRHRDAADGWADALDAIVHADPRTRDSVWLGVRQALAALADPNVLHALDPGPDDQFDPETFLTDRGTLYLLASAVSSGTSAPLIAAFVEDITETARTLAAHSPGARLDPPLLLALDEIANLTPLPSLPSLMAEGGGSGITTLAVLQSLAQARHRWGEHAADTIWDAATVKLVLGGLAKMRDLDDVSRLLGDIDETTRSQSRGRAGERSTTTSLRTVPVLPPAVLRTLPFGSAVLLLRHARPAIIDLAPWPARPDAAHLAAGQRRIEAATATTAAQPGHASSGGRSAPDGGAAS
jgi:type IV secretory pathway TraG/TraD family ATPase VirD4